MKFTIHTLGCKVNQYETQALEQLLIQRGHTAVPFESGADVYVINTCSVTAVSDKKSRQMIRKARKLSPDGIVAVCGCYPQTHQNELEDLHLDVIAGTGDRNGFVSLLESAYGERQPLVALDNSFDRRSFENLPAGGLEGRTRAMLKIEDGCVNFCSYCIIPYARGRVRSMSLADIATETQKLVAQGYREIVVTGIEISSWTQPTGEGLIDALEVICSIDPDVRIRLGSLEPRTITTDFCARASQLKNLCPHFHLSMQSGCDSVLLRMNRKYDTARYFESVQLLRTYFNRPAITTDLIVGFPQETDHEFDETLDFIKKCNFAAMHIFPYSIRPGTPAANMSEQIHGDVKSQRAAQAAELAKQMELADLDASLGECSPVLFEEEKDGLWRGHTPRYTAVTLQSEQNLHNCVCHVEITGHEQGVLQGKYPNPLESRIILRYNKMS